MSSIRHISRMAQLKVARFKVVGDWQTEATAPCLSCGRPMRVTTYGVGTKRRRTIFSCVPCGWKILGDSKPTAGKSE